jgi:hypothetical protein
MTQVGEQRGFALKRLAGFALLADQVFFERDDATHALIDRFVDRPHSTFP